MRTKNESILTVIAYAALFGGCASIVGGTTQEMTFQSSPEEALVTVSGRPMGKTPVTVQLDKKEAQSLVFSKNGYKPVTKDLTTTLEPWFWGNILLGGVYGTTTDLASGAIHKYSPNQYFVTLQPEGASPMESATLKNQRDKAREFIVGRYTNLIDDIDKGGGEDLSTLISLLNIEKDHQADALRKIDDLSQNYPDAPTFADFVIALYLK